MLDRTDIDKVTGKDMKRPQFDVLLTSVRAITSLLSDQLLGKTFLDLLKVRPSERRDPRSLVIS
jgi:hypothetical protein